MAQIYVDTGGAVGAAGTSNDPHKSLSVAEAALPATLTEPYTITCRAILSTNADTTAVTFSGVTTSAANYILVEVEAGSRHAGVWSDLKYRHTSTSSLSIRVNHLRLDGPQVRRTNSTANAQSSIDTSTIASGGSDIRIENCIVRRTGSATWTEAGISITDADATVAIRNCIVYEIGAVTGSTAITNALATLTVQNCTLVSGDIGLQRVSGTVAATNCYASGASGRAYNGTITKTTCASSDTTGDIGLQNIALNTTNFTNVTGGSEDFHIPSGSALINVGTDLSGTFTTDIDGQTRSGTWDIGADEYVVVSGDITINADLLTATFNLPAPTIVTITNVSISADVLSGTFALPASTLGLDMVVFPSPLTGTFTMRSPTIITNLDGSTTYQGKISVSISIGF